MDKHESNECLIKVWFFKEKNIKRNNRKDETKYCFRFGYIFYDKYVSTRTTLVEQEEARKFF